LVSDWILSIEYIYICVCVYYKFLYICQYKNLHLNTYTYIHIYIHLYTTSSFKRLNFTAQIFHQYPAHQIRPSAHFCIKNFIGTQYDRLCIVYGCFCAKKKSKLNTCIRVHMAHKAENIYYMTFMALEVLEILH
jgi:hypothetical protein